MKSSEREAPQISSFAAPSKAEIAAFESIPDVDADRALVWIGFATSAGSSCLNCQCKQFLPKA
jgi:hypothetical protein